MDQNLSLYKVFYTVANTFSKAAAELFISQPAISNLSKTGAEPGRGSPEIPGFAASRRGGPLRLCADRTSSFRPALPCAKEDLNEFIAQHPHIRIIECQSTYHTLHISVSIIYQHSGIITIHEDKMKIFLCNKVLSDNLSWHHNKFPETR